MVYENKVWSENIRETMVNLKAGERPSRRHVEYDNEVGGTQNKR